jgi:chromosome segregation ATPase
MKIEKQRLTRIITTIKEKFPEGNDIFGYSGVTREGITSTLDQTYSFLGLLEQINDDIEIVWIKRKLTKYFDEISSILKDINADIWIQQFDHFLDLIFEMRIDVKELYIALTDKPIRVEEDIQKAKEQYSELQNSCNSVAIELETIKNGSTKVKELLEELKMLKTSLSSANEESEKIITNITDIEENANKKKKTIEEVTPKITATFTEIKELQKTLNLDAEKVNIMSASCEKNVKKIKLREDNLQKQIEMDINNMGYYEYCFNGSINIYLI